MSVLAPLFALGALTIGLPILFHLIQRRPKGQTEFSSLMFLTPSPPRLTRRSRLDNIILLLLRAACILLLALAFARPFLRSAALLGLDTPSRRIVLLVDTSASMRRQDLWSQATKEVNAVVDDLQETDQFALMTFDDDVTQVVGFEDLADTPGARRGAIVKEQFNDVRPTWHATNLGRAVVAAADVLETATESEEQDGTLPPQVILISDMQSGSELGELDAYDWPAGVKIDVRSVTAKKTTNASLRVLNEEPGEEATDNVRIRIWNAASSQGEQFQVGWADQDGTLQGREYNVHIQAGQSRVVRMERPGAAATHVRLVGDDDAFDNAYYVAMPKPRTQTLLYVGKIANGGNREDLLHYLKQVSLDNAQRTVTVDARDPEQPLVGLKPHDTPLAVIATHVTPESSRELKRYLEGGGRVLLVIEKDADLTAVGGLLQQWTGAEQITLEEGRVRDYAMFGKIDFQHPLFQVFDDPRFNDFTKVRFWSHRRLQSAPGAWDVVAALDNDAPLLLEKRFDAGRLWILTAGWHPVESQLALSTKFVPLVMNMFNPRVADTNLSDSYTLGDAIVVPPSDRPMHIRGPDGESTEVTSDEPFAGADSPGVYYFASGDDSRPFAVNLNGDESRTAAMDIDVLEQRGVQIGEAQTMAEVQEGQRQMRDIELERRQNIWRLLIITVLGLLFVETWLGGWITRRGTAETQTTAGA